LDNHAGLQPETVDRTQLGRAVRGRAHAVPPVVYVDP
jgi:hypothetical protein